MFVCLLVFLVAKELALSEVIPPVEVISAASVVISANVTRAVFNSLVKLSNRRKTKAKIKVTA